MKPKKQCNHVGCKTLIDFNIKHCEKHKEQITKSDSYEYRKEKYGRYHRFYKTNRWERLSRLHRLKNPLCEDCKELGIIKAADVADHIIELRDDWSKRYDENNLSSKCHACHNRKTKEERDKRKQRNNER